MFNNLEELWKWAWPEDRAQEFRELFWETVALPPWNWTGTHGLPSCSTHQMESLFVF